MKIIDTFPYFNERELLELRIKLLYDHVDQFIICDADRTHTGKPKPYTCKDTLKELGIPLDKISVIEVNLPGKNSVQDDHVRENLQRDWAVKYIEQDSVICSTDCDEIIDPNVIQYYANIATENPQGILRIPMYYLSGRADFRIYDNQNTPRFWAAGFVCLSQHLKEYTLTQLRESFSLNKELKYPNVFITDDNKVKEAGWHFTWMGNNQRLELKYNSFMHYNDLIQDNEGIIDQSSILKNIKNYIPKNGSTDPLGRKDHILKKFPRELLPKKIFELPRVKNFLLPTKTWQDIPGFFEYTNFYNMIMEQMSNNTTMVEIGSWLGRSSCYVASLIKASGKNIKFYCVDTWEGSEEHKELLEEFDKQEKNLFIEFKNNIVNCELNDYITPIKMESTKAANMFEDNTVDFVHIDAAHDYENVLADINAWFPKVKAGGLITGDDYGWPGVYKAVNEFFGENNITYFDHDNQNGNVWYYKKLS